MTAKLLMRMPTDREIIEDVQIVRRAFEAELDRIKDDLTHWIEQQHNFPSGMIDMALIELAIQRLAVHNGDHTFETMEGAYKKVMRRAQH